MCCGNQAYKMLNTQDSMLLLQSLLLLLLLLCVQDRGYVVRGSGRSLVPSPLGRLLSAYLTIHFNEYVDLNFTAKIEEQLDEVSGGPN